MISPVPLHIAIIIAFTVKLNVCNGVVRRGTHKLATKKEIPLIRPLFSTIVHSVKYAKHDGMPKPNETPKRIEMTNAWDNAKMLNTAGNNEVNTPKIIHK
jgi:hypothetical protein